MKERVYEMHRATWEKVLAEAKEATYQKYGLYVSRILSVRYPEVYLKGDDLFWQIASTVDGFQEAYEIEYVADMYLMNFPDKILAGENVGRPLSMTRVDSSIYRVVSDADLYPEGYPFFSWLDRRMGPLAVTLKDKERRLTPVERAEHEYFRAKEKGAPVETLFLIVCDDSGAYLYNDGLLWSAREGEPVDRVRGNPILIFNEELAWYPLMDRDDTERSPLLAQVVDAYATDIRVPTLAPWEYEQVRRLRQATQLVTEKQFDLAALVATRAQGLDQFVFTAVWDRIFPHQDFDPWTLSVKMGVLRECIRYAAYLSPITPYLAGLVLGARNREAGIRALGQEYLKHAGVVREDEREWKKPGRVEAWGHIWGCCFLESDINDIYRTQGGAHCVSQAMNLSPVLDLAGIPHYVTHFNRGGVGARDHHFVYSRDGEFVIDDGIVNFFATDHPTTNRWGALLSFSRDGRWAGTVAGQFYGNVSPVETIEVVREINRMIGGKFTMNFLSFVGGEQREITTEEFVAYLESVQGEWKPVALP
ncbi:MAG: hypothetical protein ACUVXG_03295 [Anaerolineae bacterium]